MQNEVQIFEHEKVSGNEKSRFCGQGRYLTVDISPPACYNDFQNNYFSHQTRGTSPKGLPPSILPKLERSHKAKPLC